MVTIKTEQEIETMKKGGRRHAFILSEIAKKIAPGVSTSELNDLAMILLQEEGDKAAFLNYTPDGASRPYPAALCVSVNEEIVHGIPNESPRILIDGDIVTIDLGVIHKGLITDTAVTVGVGKVSKEDKRLMEGTKEALYAGIKEARGGNYTGDIGAAIQAIGERLKLGIVEGLAGHGVGYKVHEDPYVPNTGKKGKGDLLVPGMVIAIEPMFALGTSKMVLDKDGYTIKTKDGKKSAHFEHTIVITEGEPIILTK